MTEWVWQPWGIRCQSTPDCDHTTGTGTTLTNDFRGFDLAPRYTCRLCGWRTYWPEDGEE